jgi:Fur family iron response transcriptional regulator
MTTTWYIVDIGQVLQHHGAQPTAQRLALAEVLFARPQHLSADDVLKAAADAGIRVSKATVYNTLNLFVRCGLVREVNVDGQRVYYDSTTRPHHHFFNVDTGELTDIPSEGVRLAALPELPPGTEPDSVEIVVRIRRKRV